MLTHFIFQTTQEDGSVITDTSGLWKPGHRTLKKCTQGHQLGSGELGLHPYQSSTESLLLITKLLHTIASKYKVQKNKCYFPG